MTEQNVNVHMRSHRSDTTNINGGGEKKVRGRIHSLIA